MAYAHANCTDDEESLAAEVVEEKDRWQCEDYLQDARDSCCEQLRGDGGEAEG